MARRRRKRDVYRKSIKYEVYGIILITLSVIAFSGEAALGRSLSKLYGFVLGNYYYLLVFLGIWLGLYVMIKRSWPIGWTTRRTGFVLLACGLACWSTITVVDEHLESFDLLTPTAIVMNTWDDLYHNVLNKPPSRGLQLFDEHNGGGMVGALEYAVLYWLFGYHGARLMMWVQLGISVLLISNRSLVDMIRAVHLFFRRLAPRLAVRLASGRGPFGARAEAVGRKRGKAAADPFPSDAAQDMDPADTAEAEEEPPAPARKGKTPLFFQLFHGKVEPEQAETPGEEDWEHDQPVLYGYGERPFRDRGASGKASVFPADSLLDDLDAEPPLSGVQGGAATAAAPRPPNGTAADGELAGGYAEAVPGPEEALGGSGGSAPGSVVSGASSPAGAAAADKPYRMPPLHLLNKPQGGKKGAAQDVLETARKLEATLESFGVRAKVLDVSRGPAVTRYEVQPDVGVKVSRIVSLTDDIALALAAKDIRMEAPIPGKSAIGIEVPNPEISIVTLREVLETDVFREAPGKLTIAFGRDISGQPVIGNLARMPHLLVAGATGSGKSVCINAIIISLLYKAKPDEVKLLLIDPKMVELNVYNGIPHLLAPVVTDPRRASLALKKIVAEMEKRYERFSATGTRNIEGYNALMADRGQPEEALPYIVVIVDELADLMMVAAGDVEDAITRLAQMARAAGIHLILATQRPSVDVITGVIKANIPSRIAFGVSSQVDSRTILDMAGAEKLLGRGDMLFLPMGAPKPIRVQGAFVSDQEVEKVVQFVRGQGSADYREDLVPENGDAAGPEEEEPMDELFDRAVRIVLEAKQASVSLLQRRLRIGYTRAARLIDAMEAKGIVGPYEGSKPREVLMTLEQYEQGAERFSS
ncbi:MAG TPA: DNA translocase FtsK [Paenibacillaceae bacterium]